MAISSWICTNKSSKAMFVKIVRPGGHVELHDTPILASEIMVRNPKCIVAHPHVFKQPWAILSPDDTLNLGNKYYVVPAKTIIKLQRLAPHNHEKEVINNGEKARDCRCCFRSLLTAAKEDGLSEGSKKGKINQTRGSPKRFSSSNLDTWHPNLDSIHEE